MAVNKPNLHDPWQQGDDITADRLQALTNAARAGASIVGASTTTDSSGSQATSIPPRIQPLTSVMVWIENALVYRLNDGGSTSSFSWDWSESDQDVRGTDSAGPGKYYGFILTGRSKDNIRKPVGLPQFNAEVPYNINPESLFPDGLLNAYADGLVIPCVIMNGREHLAPTEGLLTPTVGLRTQYQIYQGTVIGMTPDNPDVPTEGEKSIPLALRNIPIVYVSDTPHWPCLVQMAQNQPEWTSNDMVGVYFGSILCGGSSPDETVTGSAAFTSSDCNRGLYAVGEPFENAKVINTDQHWLGPTSGFANMAQFNTGSFNMVPGIRVGHCRKGRTDSAWPYWHLVFASMGTIMPNLEVPSMSTVADVQAYLADLVDSMKDAGLMLRP